MNDAMNHHMEKEMSKAQLSTSTVKQRGKQTVIKGTGDVQSLTEHLVNNPSG